MVTTSALREADTTQVASSLPSTLVFITAPLTGIVARMASAFEYSGKAYPGPWLSAKAGLITIVQVPVCVHFLSGPMVVKCQWKRENRDIE